MAAKRETYEVFRYKVIYPGGTYLRISPATDAEKTGAILEFGTVFDASKSLFLDGINYAKLSDGSGWVFERKCDMQILELLQIIRVPCKKSASPESAEGSASLKSVPVDATPVPPFPALAGNRAGVAVSLPPSRSKRDLECEDSSTGHALFPQQRQQAKVENRLWRDVRARCGACGTFKDFVLSVAALKISIEGTHSPHEQRALTSISLIASITAQCSAQVLKEGAGPAEVGTCLWVLVHMGSRVAHTMALIVESANQIFEAASSSKKAHLLRVVLEVGTRTKSHAADLARQVDILPDDIRNFLQRWIIVQSFEEEKDSATLGEEEDFSRNKEYSRAQRSSSQYGSCSYDGKGGDYRVQSTPVANPQTAPSSGSWSVAIPTFASWFSSSCPSSSLPFLPACRIPGRTGSDISDSDQRHWHDPLAQKMTIDSCSRRAGPLERDRGRESVSGMLWRELVKQAEKFADTDMQLAGLV